MKDNNKFPEWGVIHKNTYYYMKMEGWIACVPLNLYWFTPPPGAVYVNDEELEELFRLDRDEA